MSTGYRALKRGLDVVIAIAATTLLLPFCILIALAVVMDSSGSPLYGARRVGRGGRVFTMYKFRSMAKGADSAGPGVTETHDYRVTRVGSFLRRTKLDELPQLLNVIKGDMSLVGPRPESPTFVSRWSAEERDVLRLRPGITGPTQLAYIDEEEQLSTAAATDIDELYVSDLMHAKLAIDLEYVRNPSVRRDLAILWRTVSDTLTAPRQRPTKPRRRYTLAELVASARLGPLVLDGSLAAVAAILAIGLRIDRNNILAAALAYWVFVPMAAVIRPAGFLLSGTYLRVWRYPTISDVVLILASLVGGSLVMTFAIFVVLQPAAFPGSVGFPRSAIIIEFLIAAVVLGGIRIASRVRQQDLDQPAIVPTGPPRPVLIYGAGDAGASLVREMRRNRALRLEPVGFVDDDSSKHGRMIYGVAVIGGLELMPEAIIERDITEVIIAMPRASGSELRRVVALCESLGIAVRTLPGVQELLDATVTVSQVRAIRVEDLLRRRPAELPKEPIRSLVGGQNILVTGAGGSIGAELARQLASYHARRLVLVERSEAALFWIDDEMRRRFPFLEVRSTLGDVSDEPFVSSLFDQERPDVVIHAAAHKHVPLSELNPGAAVLSNVRGTRVLAEVAARAGTPSFVFVSTDKAVEPTSIMGATKRLGERLIRQISQEARGRFVIVRFGNVLGSQGSVVELFDRQIQAGGPVTVTHPDMARFFMTLPEAVELILLSGSVGESGAVYVLSMGEPIRIVELAKEMIRLSGRAQDTISIEFTGLRPGERLEERLFETTEAQLPTEWPSLVLTRSALPPGDACAFAHRVEALALRGMHAQLRDELLSA
jgi:FlaA1/EpsC-like NDP-sugar epimerase/lipopolysaccharide/colanic/teichoic acid biosynthesis glycosyltransferase